MIEHGRPLIWAMSQDATYSKYAARSILVTGSPLPPSGQSALSGLEISTPMTTDLPDHRLARLPRIAGVAGVGLWVVAGFATFSASTSLAGLSLRSPLNAA
jgi:hypothetical protein